MDKVYFKVVGLYCISCKSIVERQLKYENGIKRIGVDYMTDSVIVDLILRSYQKKK